MGDAAPEVEPSVAEPEDGHVHHGDRDEAALEPFRLDELVEPRRRLYSAVLRRVEAPAHDEGGPRLIAVDDADGHLHIRGEVVQHIDVSEFLSPGLHFEGLEVSHPS